MSTLFSFTNNTVRRLISWGVWSGTELELLLYLRQYYQYYSAFSLTSGYVSCRMNALQLYQRMGLSVLGPIHNITDGRPT